MPGTVRFRLSALMFLQYAALGVWSVTFPTFLRASPHEGGLNLSGQQIGWLYATFALAAVVSPLIAGLLADTLFSTQRVLAVLHLAGAIVLVLMLRFCVEQSSDLELAFRKRAFVEQVDGEELWHRLWEHESIVEYLRDPAGYRINYRPPYPPAITRAIEWLGLWWQPMADTHYLLRYTSADDARARLGVLDALVAEPLDRVRRHPDMIAGRDRAFGRLFWLMLGYSLCYLPSVTLANAVCFRNLRRPEKQFGQARVFGTIGWIVALVVVGCALPAVSPEPLLLASATGFTLAVLCVTLPDTPPLARAKSLADWFGWRAFRIGGDRSFFTFLVCATLCSAMVAFHNVFTNPFLVDLKFGRAAAFQSIGQVAEIGGILAIPFLRQRIGFRWVLALGLLASAGRFFAYASCSAPWLVGVGLALHGVSFSLFYITAAIYVDMRAPADLRASAQGLVTQVTSGIGALAGTILSGVAVDHFTLAGAVDWRTVWLIPAVGTMAIVVVFVALFREPVTAGE